MNLKYERKPICDFCNNGESEGTCAGCGKNICWYCDVGFVIFLCDKCDDENELNKKKGQ